MAISGVRVISVPVSDQERAKDFYVNKLGLEVREDQSASGMRWILVAPRGSATAVTLVTWFETMPPGSLRGLVLASDDLMADYDRLLTLGVEFERPPKDEPWGVEAVLLDPDGNRLILQQQNARL